MDQFYKELRAIQKKERNNATLARVEENFYSRADVVLDGGCGAGDGTLCQC